MYRVEKHGPEDYRLIRMNDGTKIASYSDRPNIPEGIADDVVSDLNMANPAKEAICFILKQKWSYRVIED